MKSTSFSSSSSKIDSGASSTFSCRKELIPLIAPLVRNGWGYGSMQTRSSDRSKSSRFTRELIKVEKPQPTSIIRLGRECRSRPSNTQASNGGYWPCLLYTSDAADEE